jgi:TusA-related sulfurtransferase
MPTGHLLEILVDDPAAARDIPYAAETCGHSVVETRRDQRGGLTIIIER